MRIALPLFTTMVCGLLFSSPAASCAHESHAHEAAEDHQKHQDEHAADDPDRGEHAPKENDSVETAFKKGKPPREALTGSSDLKFRYNAELSKLPQEIANGIVRAHGGFGKAPSGELYFGLNGTGLIKLSADLKTKTLVSASESLLKGGLHNASYLDRDGGLLILPDNNTGRILVVRLDGSEVKTLGKPKSYPGGNYAPTDADIAADGNIYVCDGYGTSKLVFRIDSDSLEYGEARFGGPVPDKGRTEGKFSTNHGVTSDPKDDTLMIADRERQWIQKVTYEGEFREGFDTASADPCDVDFVDYDGERLMVVGCLKGPDRGVVQLLRDGKVVSTLKPLVDLGLDQFSHIHNAAGVVVDGKLYILCYGWNPGCYAVLEHVVE